MNSLFVFLNDNIESSSCCNHVGQIANFDTFLTIDVHFIFLYWSLLVEV